MKNVKRLSLAGIFLAIVIVFQLMGRSFPDISRPIVGPVVNAILLLTVYFSGKRYGILMGILTPILALITGQLKAPLTPLIPFIMASNVIFISLYIFWHKNMVERSITALIGAFLKYGFFLFVVQWIIPAIRLNLPASVMKMLPIAFGSVQLIAALIGAVIAEVIITLLQKRIETA